MRLLLFAIFVTCSTNTWGETLTLDQLEGSVDAASAIREAEASQTSAEARANVAEASMSPQLFGNGAIGRYTNPVFAEQYSVQSVGTAPITQIYTPQPYPYTNVYGNIGLRFPLFGSREENKRNLISANSDVRTRGFNLEVARWQTLKALRYAYAGYYFRASQENLAQSFLKSQIEAKRTLGERESVGLLLNADRLEFESMYLAAARNEAVARAGKEQSFSLLQSLTGRKLENFSPSLPVLRTDCINPSGIEVEAHPQIRLATAVLDEKRSLLESTTTSISGGINIAQGIQKDMGGSSGRDTMISFDFTAPIFASDWLKAKQSSARAEVEKARIALETQKNEFGNTASGALSEIVSKKASLAFAEKKLDSAREAYREAKIRSEVLPGDVLEKLLQKKYAFYQAANDVIEAELNLTLAKADLLGLASGCREGNAEPLPEFESVLDEPILLPAARMHNGLFLKLDFGMSELRQLKLSWYAWDGKKLLDSESDVRFWKELPHTSRILISFRKSELDELLKRKSARLDAFISKAKSRGIRVEILLGDPSWALPGEAAQLANLVLSLSGFSFSGIHLDIEHSELPQSQQPLWDQGVVEAVSAVRKASSLPIALSIHPRDAKHELLDRLRQAGLSEVAIMDYKTNRRKIFDDIEPILRENPSLSFSLSQSVEPMLPNTESYKSRKRAISSWRILDEMLEREPNFVGIIVQSLENYEALKP